MKRLAMFLIIPVSCVVLKSANKNFFPNLPIGEYKVYPRAIIQCKRLVEHVFEFNLYLNKISTNSSEVRGNFTFKKALDDSFQLKVNFAVKDSIGDWKDNYFFFQTRKACTSIKTICGNLSSMVLGSNSSYNGKDCPVPAGVYVSNGFDLTSFIDNANVPKQFFYGTYKIRIEFVDKKNNQVGCIIFIVVFKRPWETE
ncbi:MD-2-related lipid-recognition domain [Cinara cedri]|uniref:MD-2-related lipid-recognition domain n=1 Tax=Cinara cedri TaxID=506608 RepID=A0A5E4M0I0_9HEMI|nr:MD-2-related lipid-recognition domain [Cinara cedri]